MLGFDMLFTLFSLRHGCWRAALLGAIVSSVAGFRWLAILIDDACQILLPPHYYLAIITDIDAAMPMLIIVIFRLLSSSFFISPCRHLPCHYADAILPPLMLAFAAAFLLMPPP